MKAFLYINDEVLTGEPEFSVVINDIATTNNLPNSVFISAIRLLEAAEIVEKYSRGMKGTLIKVKEPSFIIDYVSSF